MWRLLMIGLCLCWASAARSEVLTFDFSRFPAGGTPPGWTNMLFGEGTRGEWKLLIDETPSPLPAIYENVRETTRRTVLAQVSTDPTDERYPILAYEKEIFHDFTLTTRLKTVAGVKERMAGLVFRLQDAKNFYVVRASSLGSTLRFYKIVNGERTEPIGISIPISSGVWHELAVECKGNFITVFLDGKQAIPRMTDYSFTRGKVGFWTKSDSVSYFLDAKVDYTPKEPLAASIVRDMMKKYPRLEELTIYVQEPNGFVRALASSNPKRIGDGGGTAELEVLKKGAMYAGKGSRTMTVTLPLHDRNGETIASVRVVMKTFVGQTDQNAIARVQPIIKQMEFRVRSREDLAP